MKLICACICVIPLILMGCGNEDKKGASEVVKHQQSENQTSKVNKAQVSQKKENPTKEKNSNRQEYDFISTTGEIDFGSKAFKQYFFHEKHTEDFGPIKVGMSKTDVEKIYRPTGTDELHGQTIIKTTSYGDIGIVYEADKVQDIYIVPHDMFQYETVLKYYGQPSTDRIKMMQKKGYVGPYEPSLIYDANPNNGYMIAVTFNGVDHPAVLYMKQMKEHHESHASSFNENKVNVLSDEFVNTFNKTSERSFAGVGEGMAKEEVDQRFGKGEMTFNIGHFPVMKYGNLGVIYDQAGAEGSKVLKVVVIPDNTMISDIEHHWGKPQHRVTKQKQKIDDGVEALIYDGDTTNDYIIVVWYKDNKVKYISKEDSKTLKGFNL